MTRAEAAGAGRLSGRRAAEIRIELRACGSYRAPAFICEPDRVIERANHARTKTRLAWEYALTKKPIAVKSPPPASSRLDVEVVAELARVVGKFDLSEIEVEHKA